MRSGDAPSVDEGKRGYSAGSHPKGDVHPLALYELRHNNYLTKSLRSKDWNEFAAPESAHMDCVFTVCDKAAAEVCPVWPGQPMTAHWGVEDPVNVEGDEITQKAAFAKAFRELQNRISVFFNLPFDSLDTLRLQEKPDKIRRLRLVDSEEPIT